MITLNIPTRQKFDLTLFCKGQWKLTGYDENLLSITPNKGKGTKTIHIKALQDAESIHKLKLLVDGQQVDMDFDICTAFISDKKNKLKRLIPNSGVLCIDMMGQTKRRLVSILQQYKNIALFPHKDGNCFYFADDIDVPVFIAYAEDVDKAIFEAVCSLYVAMKTNNGVDKDYFKKIAFDLINLF